VPLREVAQLRLAPDETRRSCLRGVDMFDVPAARAMCGGALTAVGWRCRLSRQPEGFSHWPWELFRIRTGCQNGPLVVRCQQLILRLKQG
jgi:hypothetical protein